MEKLAHSFHQPAQLVFSLAQAHSSVVVYLKHLGGKPRVLGRRHHDAGEVLGLPYLLSAPWSPPHTPASCPPPRAPSRPLSLMNLAAPERTPSPPSRPTADIFFIELPP